MTSDYIASKLSQLPRFKVEDIDHEPEKYGRGKQMLGRFSEPPRIKDQRTHLFLPDLRDICGILHVAPEEHEILLFQQYDNWPSDITDNELLAGPLAYFGHYDRNHIKLVLDSDINWIEQSVPPDLSLEKVRFEDANGQIHCIPLECFEGKPLPKGSTVFEADWSHRHCSFCWQRIESGEIGQLVEYPNGGSNWACRWCYSNAVQLHDLRALLTRAESRQ